MLEAVVFSEAGKSVEFQVSEELSGIKDTLGVWKGRALKGRTVLFTTTTLAEFWPARMPRRSFNSSVSISKERSWRPSKAFHSIATGLGPSPSNTMTKSPSAQKFRR